MNEAIIRVAAAQDQLEQPQLSLLEVEKWLSEWEVSQEEKSSYLKTLVDTFTHDACVTSNSCTSSPDQLILIFISTTSYQFKLAYVRSLPTSSAQEAAADLVASALRLPSIFDFDALFQLDAVVALKDSDIYPLLQIFLNDGYSQYKAWVASHADVLAKYSKVSD